MHLINTWAEGLKKIMLLTPNYRQSARDRGNEVFLGGKGVTPAESGRQEVSWEGPPSPWTPQADTQRLFGAVRAPLL